jgi:hypothetical protein
MNSGFFLGKRNAFYFIRGAMIDGTLRTDSIFRGGWGATIERQLNGDGPPVPRYRVRANTCEHNLVNIRECITSQFTCVSLFWLFLKIKIYYDNYERKYRQRRTEMTKFLSGNILPVPVLNQRRYVPVPKCCGCEMK